MSLSERIRIATWNCFGAPTSIEDFFAGRPFWPERIESDHVARTLADYDIVCIQENLLDRVRASLENLQRGAGFSDLWFDPMGPDEQDGTFAGGGLAILSRFPMQVRFERLPRGAGPDGFARKGYAVADVTLPSGRVLHLVNTHLQADDSNVPEGMCQDARRQQVDELIRAVASLEGPMLLCGDLNIAHGTGEYDQLRRDLGDRFEDLAAAASLVTYDVEKNDLAASFHSGGPERALYDYIFAPKRVVTSDVRLLFEDPLENVPGAPATYLKRLFASDHFGVGATLSLAED